MYGRICPLNVFLTAFVSEGVQMEKYKKISYISISAVAIIAIIYVFLKYALNIILPFAVSFLIVSLARPIINKMCVKRRIPKPFASVLVISVLLFLTAYLSVITVSYALEQLGGITNAILDNLSSEENFLSNAFEKIEEFKLRFPFLNNILPGMDESLYNVALDMVVNGFKELSGKLTSLMASFISSLPIFVVTLVVVILSLFYFSKDYDLIIEKIQGLFPKKLSGILPTVKKDISGVVNKYFKSYFILLIITFAELFSGFLILNISNSFLLAILIAFVDLLPILGVGTVLIPWGIIELIKGNTFLGVGLLILFLILYIARQFIEPKILSKQMDMHPLITIFAMYAGLKLSGLGGMIIAPFIAFVAKTVYNSIKKEKNIENQGKL